MEVELYNSMICRLCAVENSSATLLYSPDENGETLSSVVNNYLPLQIADDGKLPRTICPPCNLQLHSTKAFLDHVVDGQQKLRELWKQQVELQKKLDKERLRIAQGQDIIIPETITAEDGTEAQILIHLPGGTIFTAGHSLSLKMEGLEKPKRKRGRPPKQRPDPEQMPAVEASSIAEKDNEQMLNESMEQDDMDDDGEEEGEGRRRRKKKIPRRFMEAVQGKELERIFREEGVIDEDDDEGGKANMDSSRPAQSTKDEVIGHLETPDGGLGELVIVNRGRGRGRPRNSKKRKINYECEVCGRGFQHRSRYTHHKNYHKGVKYECGTCQKQFNSKDNLDLHHKTLEHSGEVVIEAPMEVKKDDGSGENSLHCDKCNKEFLTKEDFEVHLQTVHENDKPYKCQLCPMTFPYQSSLKYHIKSQHDTGNSEQPSSSGTTEAKSDGKGGYECDICGKVLNHPSSVLYHKEAEHNDGRRFVCSKCGKGFKHKQLLQRHQLVHSEDRPYVCGDCGSSFKTKANWLNHQSTHTGEKKFFCDLCGHQFAHKTSLTLHYRWHAGHKPYECHVCQKKFSQNGNLQEHLRIHSGEKPFCCDYCGRKFTTSSQFKLHVKRHTGERPWKCEYCGKSFLHKDTWKCHTRRHKGEKPFRCNFCTRGFTEQWALKKHMRLHTGEKPYSCNVCGKSFADCSNLTKHKKVHRENNKVPLGNTLPMDRAVWNIIRQQMPEELGGTAGSDEMVGLVPGPSGVTSVNEDGEAVQQIIYVSYQDPDDPSESHTLHIVDDVAGSASDDLKLLSAGDDTTQFGDAVVGDTTLDLGHLIAPQGVPVTDEEGNPIHFTMQDGSQLQITTPDGQSLMVTTEDGRAIPVQLTTAEGHPISTGFPGADVSVPTSHLHIGNDLGGKSLACVGDGLIVEHSGVGVVDSDGDVGQHIEFTTEDGQKLRFVASSDVNQLQLVADLMSSHMSQVP
ncbi:zinc finger protein 835-like [Thrips palmi]|uniref:Zinc finger protein 835-like n=1 Tax=Thrips palmi TaxID=161013 RepID=A0A6P8ZHA9_THRPL|nr:zinc finger protein 835-like [Thrips palmi]